MEPPSVRMADCELILVMRLLFLANMRAATILVALSAFASAASAAALNKRQSPEW